MATEEKNRYSAEELKEFEAIIKGKLEETNAELKYLRAALSKKMIRERMTPQVTRR